MTSIRCLLPGLAGLAAALCGVLASATDGAPAVPAAVEARFPAPATRYDTPGLLPGRDSYTSNEEMRAALHELAGRPQGPRLLAAGGSHLGVAIEALQFSRGPARPTFSSPSPRSPTTRRRPCTSAS